MAPIQIVGEPSLMPIQWPFRPRPESSRSDLWTSCPGCSEMIYNKQLEKNLRVCPKCGHYFRLRVDARLGHILDPDSFEERDAGLESLDPLGFVDLKTYPERVAEQKRKTELKRAEELKKKQAEAERQKKLKAQKAAAEKKETDDDAGKAEKQAAAG